MNIEESELENENRNSVPILAPGIGTRIRRAIEKIGTQAEAAEAAGVTVATLQRYMKEQSAPTFEAMAGLSRRSGVDFDWLAFELPRISEESAEYAVGDFLFVPRIELPSSAGNGAIFESERESCLLAFRLDWLRKNCITTQDLSVIEARGDSMEPTISSGDLLLIDLTQRNPGVPGIFVLRTDDTLLVKRLQLDLRGQVVARSDNQAYGELVASPDEIDVVGRIVWSGRGL